MKKRIIKILFVVLLSFSILTNCAHILRKSEQPKEPVPVTVVQETPVPPPALTAHAPVTPVKQLEEPASAAVNYNMQPAFTIPQEDIIFFNIKEWTPNLSIFIKLGESSRMIRYDGENRPIYITKNMLPLDVNFIVNEDQTQKYKNTTIRITEYNNGQKFDVSLKKRLYPSSEKVILLFVNLFNSAYEYYKTNDIRAFKNINPGSFYYLAEDAFEEISKLDTEEIMKIVDLVNKNIKLPKNEVVEIVRKGISLGHSFYLKKTAKNLTPAEDVRLKEQITNDFTELWWNIFDLMTKSKVEKPQSSERTEILSETTKKTVLFLVDVFNNAYEYYETKDIDILRKIQPGAIYYVLDAVDEMPKLGTAEIVEIVNLINKNIKLPQTDITNFAQRGINIIKNFYVQKNDKKLSKFEQTKIKEELINDITKLMWDIIDLLKQKNEL
ncbi:MAG TPA: hypothetical protein PLM75_01455 [bacterium]|nr:hypothetical protein [bacterium]HPP86511.1 hypothetical protein [bacterium]